MPIDVLMPQLSPTMTEGRLAGWLKKEGDKVATGDIIAEVETDKATMEVEATEDGIIHTIIGEVGADITVGAPIAVLAEEGEDVPKDYKPTSQAAPTPAEEEKPAEAKTPAPTPTPQPAPAAPQPVPAAPVSQPISAPQPSATGRIIASPLAKKLASKLGVNLATLHGTGPGGRIVKKDVETGPVAATGAGPIMRQEDVLEKHSPMRKAIAARLTSSKQYTPHFYVQADVQMDSLLEIRQQINSTAPKNGDVPAYKVTVNDFVVKACAMALAKHPAANAGWTEENMLHYGNVDMSVAVAIEGGLITPIVRNADQKSVVAISGEVKQLAAAAKAGKLKPEQYEGGSFSISNMGMYGVDAFSAIINPPQAAILACGAAKPKAVADEEGNIYSAQVMTITLSVDHRVIDGALAAELMETIRTTLENPASMLVSL